MEIGRVLINYDEKTLKYQSVQLETKFNVDIYFNSGELMLDWLDIFNYINYITKKDGIAYSFTLDMSVISYLYHDRTKYSFQDVKNKRFVGSGQGNFKVIIDNTINTYNELMKIYKNKMRANKLLKIYEYEQSIAV